jgi:FkbM family methyltransferase
MSRPTRRRALALSVLRVLGRLIPDGALRERLWALVLALRPTLPKELVANRGDVVLAVGTPRPATVDRFVNIVGHSGTVVVIEADPTNAERLTDHVASHRIANVTVVPKGAWNAKGQHRLRIANHPGDHRLDVDSIVHDNDLREDYASSTIVEVDTADSILTDLGLDDTDIGFVEITVNGVEVQVLEGMEKTLTRTSRLFVKGHARDTQTGAPINTTISAFLNDEGFRTTITRPSKSRAGEWGLREGDVFAWRP